jgi:hypothetical protein
MADTTLYGKVLGAISGLSAKGSEQVAAGKSLYNNIGLGQARRDFMGLPNQIRNYAKNQHRAISAGLAKQVMDPKFTKPSMGMRATDLRGKVLGKISTMRGTTMRNYALGIGAGAYGVHSINNRRRGY